MHLILFLVEMVHVALESLDGSGRRTMRPVYRLAGVRLKIRKELR